MYISKSECAVLYKSTYGDSYLFTTISEETENLQQFLQQRKKII